MKKISTVQVFWNEIFKEQKLTIGVDLGESLVVLLWDEIARTFDVDILCGYPLSGDHYEENSHVFQRICAEHSAVYS